MIARSLSLVLLAAAALAAQPKSVKVTRITIAVLERNTDQRLTENRQVDFESLGGTRGVYINGFGAVFTSEVNLVASAVPMPFPMPKEYWAGVRQKKLDRIPVLKTQMKQALMALATAFDSLDAAEQLVLSVSLYYNRAEDATGMPSHIMMQASRADLLALSRGGTANIQEQVQ